MKIPPHAGNRSHNETVGTVTTKVTKAASNRQSLRTTIPKEVVKHLGLKDGDSLIWSDQFYVGLADEPQIRYHYPTILVDAEKRKPHTEPDGPNTPERESK